MILEGPIHHWRYPIRTYTSEAMAAENLYLTKGTAHRMLHQAMGPENAPFNSMVWGIEPEIQSMVNFWLPAP
jgi:hypothetical protein